MLNDQLDQRNIDEQEEILRIQKKVQKLREIERNGLGKKLIAASEYLSNFNEGIAVNPDDAKFKVAYTEMWNKQLADESLL